MVESVVNMKMFKSLVTSFHLFNRVGLSMISSLHKGNHQPCLFKKFLNEHCRRSLLRDDNSRSESNRLDQDGRRQCSLSQNLPSHLDLQNLSFDDFHQSSLLQSFGLSSKLNLSKSWLGHLHSSLSQLSTYLISFLNLPVSGLTSNSSLLYNIYRRWVIYSKFVPWRPIVYFFTAIIGLLPRHNSLLNQTKFEFVKSIRRFVTAHYQPSRSNQLRNFFVATSGLFDRLSKFELECLAYPFFIARSNLSFKLNLDFDRAWQTVEFFSSEPMRKRGKDDEDKKYLQ